MKHFASFVNWLSSDLWSILMTLILGCLHATDEIQTWDLELLSWKFPRVSINCVNPREFKFPFLKMHMLTKYSNERGIRQNGYYVTNCETGITSVNTSRIVYKVKTIIKCNNQRYIWHQSCSLIGLSIETLRSNEDLKHS